MHDDLVELRKQVVFLQSRCGELEQQLWTKNHNHDEVWYSGYALGYEEGFEAGKNEEV